MSKKFSYALLAVSAGLVAVNLDIGTISPIEVPNTTIKVPGVFVWLIWLFLFIPYINEINKSGVNLKRDIKKRFDSELCSWSRRMKDKACPELYTPLIDVSKVKGRIFSWKCMYHQAGNNPEPSFSVISSTGRTTVFIVLSFTKVLFKFELLDRVTLPIFGIILALLTKGYNLWQIP